MTEADGCHGSCASVGVVARVALLDFAHPPTDASTHTREEREKTWRAEHESPTASPRALSGQ